MGEIKTAYEKALERFQDVSADKVSLHKTKAIEKGNRLCASYLNGEEIDLDKELGNVEASEKEWVIEGMSDTILAQISLPSDDLAIQRIDKVKELVLYFSPQPQVAEQLLAQYKQVCEQYLSTKKDLTEQMKAQYMQMMQQQGQQGAGMDQNFLEAMQKQLKDLDEQFKPAIQKVKQHLRQVCGFALEK